MFHYIFYILFFFISSIFATDLGSDIAPHNRALTPTEFFMLPNEKGEDFLPQEFKDTIVCITTNEKEEKKLQASFSFSREAPITKYPLTLLTIGNMNDFNTILTKEIQKQLLQSFPEPQAVKEHKIVISTLNEVKKYLPNDFGIGQGEDYGIIVQKNIKHTHEFIINRVEWEEKILSALIALDKSLLVEFVLGNFSDLTSENKKREDEPSLKKKKINHGPNDKAGILRFCISPYDDSKKGSIPVRGYSKFETFKEFMIRINQFIVQTGNERQKENAIVLGGKMPDHMVH